LITTLPPVPPFVPSVMLLVPVSVVNAPELAVPPPIAPGAAKVAPPRLAALMLVLHPQACVLLLYCVAAVDAEQLPGPDLKAGADPTPASLPINM
jgi:hypothetical protein